MDDWQSWIGRRSTALAWLDPAQANRMRATLDREPVLGPGDPLPLAWHWLYFSDAVRAADLNPAGHPRPGLTLPAVALPRRSWAGGSLTFRRPLLLATTVERVSTIRAIIRRRGWSGPVTFVTVEHLVREVGPEGMDDDPDAGPPALVEEQTILFRGPTATDPPPTATATDPTAPTPTAADPTAPTPTAPAVTRTWSLDSIALFRYSALTFNAHRIHYDADYCRDVEGYPGLVVHGPLLATLLLDLAVGHGRRVHRFDYTAHRPLFLPGPFTVHGRPDGDATVLWAAGSDGRLAMRARTDAD